MIKISGRENVGHHFKKVISALKKLKSSVKDSEMNLSGRQEEEYKRRDSSMAESSPPKKLTAGRTVDVGQISGLGTSGGALNYKNMADAVSKQQVSGNYDVKSYEKSKTIDVKGLNQSDRAASLRGSNRGDGGMSVVSNSKREDANYFAFLDHESLAYEFTGRGQIQKG